MANEPVITFSRRFLMWSFTIGHGQLILRSTKERSPKEQSPSTRIDVLFKDVGLIYLAKSLEDLQISIGSEEDKERLSSQLGKEGISDRELYLVNSSGFSGYVVAGVVAWHEDQGEYYDPSHFDFRPNEP